VLFLFSRFTQDCIKAKGCDRHLLGLRILAMQSGGAMPSIFTDPMYAKSTKWRLSTSTVRTVREQNSFSQLI
jgi:carnitine O-acetyltransferase